ncbi:MAG: DUF1786 domain-containing protein [Chloroflexota bacterium]
MALLPGSVLAIDVGAGTQDILVFDPDREPENCGKLVLPSRTRIVAGEIQAATAQRRPVHLTGPLMGGGASTDAIRAHLDSGLPVTATESAARTVHNAPERILSSGVVIADHPMPNAVVVKTGDIDLSAIQEALGLFGVTLPPTIAVAVQDHGYRPGSGNNDVRFDFLNGLLRNGGDLATMVYHQSFQLPPEGMTRMEAIQRAIPGAWVMDTGAAAVLGALGDPVVAAAANDGVVLVNFGNMHTFATLVRGRRLYGLFEHHTSGMTTELVQRLVSELQTGTLDTALFRNAFDGHGAAIDPAYADAAPFRFVTITGPNRRIARPLGFHEAAPHGDMMLAGCWGLVEGIRLVGERSSC